MTFKPLCTLFLLGLFSVGLFAQTETRGFSTNQNGLKYKLFNKEKKDTLKPKTGDMMTVVAYYQTPDTIFFDSRKSPTPYIFPVLESTYPGDIFDGLRMLSVGDTAQFELSGDDLFLKTFKTPKLPPYIKEGSKVNFFVRVDKIQSREVFQQEMRAKMEQESKQNNLMRMKEDSILKVYLAKNNIKATPTSSGLIYIEEVKGHGIKAEPGKKVQVHYTGRLLDGTKFDSSYDRGNPLSIDLGKGMVIAGWDEGIAKMNMGGKAKLIIPSKIGYGERGFGKVIPPFSTLIFDVELVDVK